MIRILIRVIKALLMLCLVLGLVISLFLLFAPVLGGSPDEKSVALIQQSKNYNGEKFFNKVPTVVSTPSQEEPMDLWSMIRPPAGKNPTNALPAKYFDKANFDEGDFAWFGHSTVLFKTDGLTVITDPVFYNASPVPKTIKPFATDVSLSIDQLPNIDVVAISHDHYDHLDYPAIVELDSKVGRYLVPLGVKAHLQKWGVDDEKITEMDWYDNVIHQSLSFTLAPSRHFSGRSIQRAKTLWGSWIVKSNDLNIYFSGDSGYFEEFKKIGEQYGPFDLAFIENGAYNINWSQIHMMPEESVQAVIDLNAKVFFPIHWGKYDLASHTWSEPVIRAKSAADKLGVRLATPLIGEIFTVSDYPVSEWWLNVQ